MATFIRVHTVNKETFFVNVDRIEAISISEDSQSAVIYFIGSEDDILHVEDSERDLYDQLKYGGMG